MVVELLQINKRNLRRFLNLANNLFGEVVKMFLGVHKFLKIDHRVKVTHDKEFVLAASHIHIDLVHRDVLGVASICILLHFWVVILHLIRTNVK